MANIKIIFNHSCILPLVLTEVKARADIKFGKPLILMKIYSEITKYIFY